MNERCGSTYLLQLDKEAVNKVPGVLRVQALLVGLHPFMDEIINLLTFSYDRLVLSRQVVHYLGDSNIHLE